ncbi:MAG: NAD(P)H-dependent oxidoreductase [Candidatus Pacebacteria bacterium]|nr:NAD(P)H-dependent oxidoreductase [Candidatus Paceibacterota bacterium]
MNKEKIREKIIKSLKWRYATKVFDSSKIVSEDDINTILESARLSPSSIGIEMWKFIVVKNKELREKLREVSYNQPQITDASYLIVIAQRTDAVENMTKERMERTAKILNAEEDSLVGLKTMLEGSITQKSSDGSLDSWIKSQTYIPLGIMLETAALLDIDACPMEGFLPEKVDEILGLKDKNLKSSTMLTVGYRGVDKMSEYPKVRREFDDAIEFI